MWYMGTGGILWSTSKCIYLLSEGPYYVQECVWATLGDQQRDVKSLEVSPQGVLHLY